MNAKVGLVLGVMGMISAGGALAAGDAAAGMSKAKELCVACHGDDGNSPAPQTPQAPVLAGQHADYLEMTLEQYASGARPNPIMASFVTNLSAEDRANLAAYYASQTGLRVIEYED